MTDSCRMMPSSFGGFSKEDAERYLEEQRKTAEAKPEKPSEEQEKNNGGADSGVQADNVIDPPAQTANKPDPFDIQHAHCKYANGSIQGYQINGVKYSDGLVDVFLQKEPIELGWFEKILGGKSYNSWHDYLMQHNQFPHPVSAKMHHAIFKALYEHKGDPAFANAIQSARNNFDSMINKHRVITMTKIKSDDVGNHTVLHYGEGSYTVTDYTPLAPEKCILGEQDPAEIIRIYNWLTGNVPCWGSLDKFRDGEERVFSFVADLGNMVRNETVLDAYTKPSKRGYAMGVKVDRVYR